LFLEAIGFAAQALDPVAVDGFFKVAFADAEAGGEGRSRAKDRVVRK
jgi:hypothetical protein